ncbi:uncharacterized protein CC84DRAFT_806296 [Paraphaeosphaeria sporulosa]|uniref:Uncharacterized protein n=1 Tax=Paraphaeosphaeria sporulosa TaxID=1460663 RepID=A0A177CDL9_9PLEO|nr:uncharacterized protein CC84DRAFT_806296 [Paraphaeosphaeria sporulosa]OAG04858.1 hypothetical protein CC84DRAFT_806296 [Paraphaeosphaeria sporulosa]
MCLPLLNISSMQSHLGIAAQEDDEEAFEYAFGLAPRSRSVEYTKSPKERVTMYEEVEVGYARGAACCVGVLSSLTPSSILGCRPFAPSSDLVGSSLAPSSQNPTVLLRGWALTCCGDLTHSNVLNRSYIVSRRIRCTLPKGLFPSSPPVVHRSHQRAASCLVTSACCASFPAFAMHLSTPPGVAVARGG